MFYSQTFLARKGPLGTVWCAAHLQHRLKKSHYTSTDIPSTVDLIMCPEVPIALRMSGHLLLGVVRIYSKKVDYLYQDCNVVLTGLRKAFASIELNLQEDARQAPVESVTLPETLNLEAFNFDDDLDDGGLNSHLKSQEDITLSDQIPIEGDPYVIITFDEDIMDPSHPSAVPDSGIRPMDVDNLPTSGDIDPNNQMEEPNVTLAVQDPGRGSQPEVPTMAVDTDLDNQSVLPDSNLKDQYSGPSNLTEALNIDSSPQNLPEVEIMRDAVPDLSPGNLPTLCPDRANNTSEPIRLQASNEKENQSPVLEDVLASGGESLLFQQRSEPPASTASQDALEIFDTRVSFGHSSPALAVRSTPPVQRPVPRPRKRKLFDRSTVLSNRFMKQALQDSTDLLRVKRNAPHSALGVWKLNSSVRKEQIFSEPLLTGFSADLSNIFRKDYISTRHHLTVPEEAILEPMVAQSPTAATEATSEPRVEQSNPIAEANQEPTAQSPVQLPENDMEIEILRDNRGDAVNHTLPEVMPSVARSSPARSLPSPFRTDVFTPSSMNSFGEGSLPQAEASGTGVMPTPDFTVSTAPYGSEIETPRTYEQLGVESTGLSNIAESGDLHFLEAEYNTPAGSEASQGVDSLSVRTRAVAQYFKNQSGDLSLNKILEGKTRKICARMFYETLVLKSYGLVDVQQEQPYGDITLKLTSMLSKAHI